MARTRSPLGRCAALLLISSASVAAACATTGANVGPLPAGMTMSAQERHYDVTGSTAAEIRASMLALAPRLAGRRTLGRHTWSIRWNYRYRRVGGGCRMHDVRVVLISTTSIPRWSPPPGVPDTLIDQWNAFSAALAEHERGHRDISVASGREILAALRSLRAPSCIALETDARALGERILARYREQDARYDRETRAGRTQGAVWPPGNLTAETGTGEETR